MILGLDISTSIIGVCIVDYNGTIRLRDIIKLKKLKDSNLKAKEFEKYILNLKKNYKIEEIYIEKSLFMFSSGRSSAKVLFSLASFNGVTSYICYDKLGITPKYISATTARKNSGIGNPPKGTKAKQHIMENIQKIDPDFVTLYTRHGNPKPEMYDMADAIVIALAGLTQSSKK